MSKPLDDIHRAELREAWIAAVEAGRFGNAPARFSDWYDKAYPPPTPPEPHVGSVRGHRTGAYRMWAKFGDGFWYRAGATTRHTWADAIAAGLDPSRVFVEVPVPRCCIPSSGWGHTSFCATQQREDG